jgi:glycosyltransferase involved in cell wall biosynthesis
VSRITFDYTPAIHQGAGIGRLTRELGRALLQLQSPHTFSFFVMGRPGDDVPLSSIMYTAQLPLRVTQHNDRWLYRLWFRSRLPLPVQTFSGACDLYHATDFVLPPVRGRAPTVLTVHDLSFERDPDSASPRLIPFLKRVVPDSARRATHIVADSNATAHDLTELYGIPPAKITTIYSGASERFTPYSGSFFEERRRTAILRRYKIGDAPFVLTVGTMQKRKNHLRLVQAFAKVIAQHPSLSSLNPPLPTQLVIAGGKGWLYDDVLAEVKVLGLEDRVKFIGYVEDSDLPHLYRAARVFAFPSIYEGFGIPPLEAMACGVPVVTSNASSLPEVVGDAGLQVNPFDVDALAHALDTALHDEGWRAQAIELGIARAKQFTWHSAAEQLMAIYDEVIGNR